MGADQVLLVNQTQDRHRRPTSPRVRRRGKRSADGQDRMEEKTLLSLLRSPDRTEARHRLLAMTEGRKRRVLNEQISSGRLQLVLDQTTMRGLDRVGSDFAPVEKVVGGVNVVLPSEQLGNRGARPLGQGLSERHETSPPGAMPQPSPPKLRGRPNVRRRLMQRRQSKHDWLHPQRRIQGHEHPCYQILRNDKCSAWECRLDRSAVLRPPRKSRGAAQTIGVGKAHWFEPPPLRTVRADFPHTALQSVVLPPRGLTRQAWVVAKSNSLCLADKGVIPGPPLVKRAANSRVVPSNSTSHVTWRVGRFGASSPYRYGQSDRGVFRCLELHDSTFLHPFAPPELPGFDATMGALTPARRFFASSLRLVTGLPAAVADDERRLVRAGLSASCAWPSDHSASNHPTGPTIALTRYPSASWASGSPRSGLRLE